MSLRSVVGALALLIAAGPTPSQALGPDIGLDRRAPIHTDVDALPRLKPQPNVAYERINRAFEQFDADARSAVEECAADAKEMTSYVRGSFFRDVSVPMVGPHYLTIRIDDDTYCTGLRPVEDITAITYDLSTGKPVDWVALLGPILGGKTNVNEKSGKPNGSLSSPIFFRLWMKARKYSNEDLGENCKAMRKNSKAALHVWADAQAGGIVVQSMDVGNASEICGSPVVVPLSALRGKGVSAKLLDSIAAGKRSTIQSH